MNKPSKDLLAIDLNRLEECCRENPQLTYNAGVDLADAKKRTKDAKNLFKLKCAEMRMNIRSQPSSFGLEKVTEQSVDDALLTQPEHGNYQDQQIQAEYEEDILKAFVEAVADRREQLGNECKLHGQMYWSKADTSLGMETEQTRTAASQAAGASINKPKRSK